MASEILRNFANQVRCHRKRKRWSQETLAQKAGLHRTYIGSIERRERNVSLVNVEKIAKALAVSVAKLVN